MDLAAPGDLTVWDRAYLHALYSGGGQINLSMQQSVLADQMAQMVRGDAQAAGAPPPGSAGHR